MTKVPCALMLCLTLVPQVAVAAEKWLEIKSPHFTVWSSRDSGDVRTLLWQLEQIRGVMVKVFPWAQVDLPRPLLVIAARDEREMRALVPQLGETVRSRVPSVWLDGPNSQYLVIRVDLHGPDAGKENPYRAAYFSYLHLVLKTSFPRSLPLWFLDGLAGVMSNTVVREDSVLIGVPIQSYIGYLREGANLSMAQLLKVTPREFSLSDTKQQSRFRAQSWALMHFLLYGDRGAHGPKISKLTELLFKTTEPNAAVADVLGPPDAYETSFKDYVHRNVFSFVDLPLDASVTRERFAATPIPDAEANAGRAAWHLAMRRGDEARVLLEQARKADPDAAGVFMVEGLQAERTGDQAAALAAYDKAVQRGTTSAYVHYRYAVMTWQASQDEAALNRAEKSFARAVELSPSYAAAHAGLGEIRGVLGRPLVQVMPLLAQAVKLEPGNPWHYIARARVLVRLKQYDEARKAAAAALGMATAADAKAAAQAVLTELDRIGGG